MILVIDAAHLAASAGAIALGFRTFDPEVNVAGVILNRWNPSRSRIAVEKAMEHAGLPSTRLSAVRTGDRLCRHATWDWSLPMRCARKWPRSCSGWGALRITE